MLDTFISHSLCLIADLETAQAKWQQAQGKGSALYVCTSRHKAKVFKASNGQINTAILLEPNAEDTVGSRWNAAIRSHREYISGISGILH